MMIVRAVRPANAPAAAIYLPIVRIRDARFAVWEMARIARAQVAAETSEEPETEATIAAGIRDCGRFDLLAREVDAYCAANPTRRADLFRHFPELAV